MTNWSTQGFKSPSKNPKNPKNPKFVFIFLEDPKKYLKTPKTPNKPQILFFVQKPLLILWFWSYFLNQLFNNVEFWGQNSAPLA